MSWKDLAACINEDPELFFPEHEVVDDPTVRLAKRICRSCDVLSTCLSYAVARAAREDSGIWGATTARERSFLRTARREAAARKEQRRA